MSYRRNRRGTWTPTAIVKIFFRCPSFTPEELNSVGWRKEKEGGKIAGSSALKPAKSGAVVWLSLHTRLEMGESHPIEYQDKTGSTLTRRGSFDHSPSRTFKTLHRFHRLLLLLPPPTVNVNSNNDTTHRCHGIFDSNLSQLNGKHIPPLYLFLLLRLWDETLFSTNNPTPMLSEDSKLCSRINLI